MTVSDGKLELIQHENAELKAKLEALENKDSKVEPGKETLKLRVKFLQGRIEQQEKKLSMYEISKKGGDSALMKEIDNLRKRENVLEKEKSSLEETNVEMKCTVETIQHNMLVLNEIIKEFE